MGSHNLNLGPESGIIFESIVARQFDSDCGPPFWSGDNPASCPATVCTHVIAAVNFLITRPLGNRDVNLRLRSSKKLGKKKEGKKESESLFRVAAARTHATLGAHFSRFPFNFRARGKSAKLDAGSHERRKLRFLLRIGEGLSASLERRHATLGT